MRRRKTQALLTALAALLTATAPAAQDCNGNGITDSAEMGSAGPGIPTFASGKMEVHGDLLLLTRNTALEILDAETLMSLASVPASDGCTDVVGRGTRLITTDGQVDVSDPANPAYTPFGGKFADALALWGEWLYALDLSTGDLTSYDVSDPDAWIALDTLNVVPAGSIAAVDADAGALCIGDDAGQLIVVDADDPWNLSVAGSTGSTGSILDLEVVGRTAYAAHFDQDGLALYDVSDLASPRLVSTARASQGVSLAVRGDTVFVGAAFGVAVVDVADRSAPLVKQRLTTGNLAGAILFAETAGDWVAFKNQAGVLEKWKLGGADPAVPETALLTGFTGPTSSLSAAGDLLYVSNRYGGLDVVDVRRPDDPVHVGDWQPTGPAADVRGFVAVDEYGYAADADGSLVVVDLATPRCPTTAAAIAVPAGAEKVVHAAPWVFVATPSGLAIVDVTTPTAPSSVGVVPALGTKVRDVVLVDRYAVTFEDTATQIVDVGDLAAGPVVVYQDIGQPGDYAGGAAYGRSFLALSQGAPYLLPVTLDAFGQPLVTSNGVGLPAVPLDVSVSGTWAVVGMGPAGYALVDLEDYVNPSVASVVATGTPPSDFALHRGRVWAAGPAGELSGRRWRYEPAYDCDGNGVPDECDIADMTLADVDGDGVPDLCELGAPTPTCDHVPADDGGAAVADCGTTLRVSLTDGGGEICVSDSAGNKNSSHPWVSADGNVVVFTNEGEVVTGETNASEKKQVYARDVTTGDVALLSGLSNAGTSWGGTSTIPSKPADNGAVSGDGRYVAFTAVAQLPGDDDSPDLKYRDVFLHDLEAGTTERVSEVRTTGEGQDGDALWRPAISFDGQLVAFTSRAGNLTGGASSGLENVYLYDRTTDTITLVSAAASGQPDGDSRRPSMSGDGCWIAFESDATNLDPAGSPGGTRIYVYRRATGVTRLVDRGLTPCAQSGQGDSAYWNADSGRPFLSADGRWVAFESRASNLVWSPSGFPPQVTLADTDQAWDVFVADTATWRVRSLAHGLPLDTDHFHELGRLSGDGRFVVFNRRSLNDASANDFELWVHDRDVSNSGVYDQPNNSATLRITDEQGCLQANSWSGGPGNLSEDGRYAVFVSDASDVVSGDTNGDPNGPCASSRGADVFRRELY